MKNNIDAFSGASQVPIKFRFKLPSFSFGRISKRHADHAGTERIINNITNHRKRSKTTLHLCVEKSLIPVLGIYGRYNILDAGGHALNDALNGNFVGLHGLKAWYGNTNEQEILLTVRGNAKDSPKKTLTKLRRALQGCAKAVHEENISYEPNMPLFLTHSMKLDNLTVLTAFRYLHKLISLKRCLAQMSKTETSTLLLPEIQKFEAILLEDTQSGFYISIAVCIMLAQRTVHSEFLVAGDFWSNIFQLQENKMLEFGNFIQIFVVGNQPIEEMYYNSENYEFARILYLEMIAFERGFKEKN